MNLSRVKLRFVQTAAVSDVSGQPHVSRDSMIYSNKKLLGTSALLLVTRRYYFNIILFFKFNLIRFHTHHQIISREVLEGQPYCSKN